MIYENPIFIARQEALEAKPGLRVTSMQPLLTGATPPRWEIPIKFEDGANVLKQFPNLSHNQFQDHWTEFADWHRRTRGDDDLNPVLNHDD